jgi:hypothetical protein
MNPWLMWFDLWMVFTRYPRKRTASTNGANGVN